MASSHPVVTHPYAATLIRIKARQLCRRTDFRRCDVEDLQQSMWAYLIEKASLYDPQRANIEAFVTNLVTTWVKMELRKRGREKRRLACRDVSLDSTMVESDGDQVPLASVLGEADLLRRLGQVVESSIDRVDLREAIAHAMSQMTADERELVFDVMNTGITATAQRHNVSPSTVRRYLNRMKHLFREAGLDLDAR
ncbi:MAG: hypothetical protein AAF085_00085 [Planctomycetota bacterium]